MKSNNPVFNNNPAFNGQASYPQAYPQQGYAQGGYPPPPPGAFGAQPQYAPQTPEYGAPQGTRAMTIDDVVQKTGISLAVVFAVGAALWLGTGDITSTSGNASLLYGATMLGMAATFIIGMIAMFKKTMMSPAFVLVYAAAEGLFMGGVSKTYSVMYQDSPIVVQALLGTVFAAGGMLAAYKFFNIKVGDKFRKAVFAASFGFLGLIGLELVLSLFGNPIGFFGNGGMGFVFALVGLAFGVVGLILDFDMVENGIRAGVPEKFAWTAAFGLTASLVTIYFYLLRLLAILQDD